MFEHIDPVLNKISSLISTIPDGDFYVFNFVNDGEGKSNVSDVPLFIKSSTSDIYIEIYRILTEFLKTQGYSLKIYQRSNGTFWLCISTESKIIPLAIVSGPIEGIELLQCGAPFEVDVEITCVGEV